MLKILKTCCSFQSTQITKNTSERRIDKKSEDSDESNVAATNASGDKETNKLNEDDIVLRSVSKLRYIYESYETCDLRNSQNQQQPLFIETNEVVNTDINKDHLYIKDIQSKIPILNKIKSKVYPTATKDSSVQTRQKLHETDPKNSYKPVFLPPLDKINFSDSLIGKNLLNQITRSSRLSHEQHYFAKRFKQMTLLQNKSNLRDKSVKKNKKPTEKSQFKNTNIKTKRKSKKQISHELDKIENKRLNYVINWLKSNGDPMIFNDKNVRIELCRLNRRYSQKEKLSIDK